MSNIYLFAFTRSALSDEPMVFCSLMAEHLPQTVPEYFFQGEDETTPFPEVFSDVQVAAQFTRYWFNQRVSWERTNPRVRGTGALGNKDLHTAIRHTFDEKLATSEACCRFFSSLVNRLGAEFAYFHLIPANGRMANPADARLGGATSLNIHATLPGIPWAAWYGPPYVELFGKKTLLSTPVHEVIEVAPDVVYLQLTSDFSDLAQHPQLVKERQTAVLAHLGRDAFFDPGDKKRRGKVPRFARPIVQHPVGIKNSGDPKG